MKSEISVYIICAWEEIIKELNHREISINYAHLDTNDLYEYTRQLYILIQEALLKRLTTFDPLASNWLTGVSWQFAAPGEEAGPPMPPPTSWTASAVMARPQTQPEPVGGTGDVISGPSLAGEAPTATAAQNNAEAKADLAHLFAVRDADFQRHSAHEASDAGATQPMFLCTEPAKL